MSQKYIDNEADFWKEIFVHLQHKNMVRTNAQPLRFAECKEAFDAFSASHPDARIATEYSASYCTFELTINSNTKLRLYIQSSIKGSIMQKKGAEYIKVCDAKFPYNPLPEIDEFICRLPEYLKELESSLENKASSLRRQKLALEFIKAYASKHIPQNQAWKIEPKSDGNFTLTLLKSGITLELTDQDFKEKVLHIFA